MIEVKFIQSNGEQCVVLTEPVGSLMQLALANNVGSILGDCGGTCGCGTCQVHVDEHWMARLPSIADDEADMLSLSENLTPQSRLACQIKLKPELHGLTVRVPEVQG